MAKEIKNKDFKNSKDIEKKLEECESLKKEYLTGWQRSRADFLNYKKQETERMKEIGEFLKAKVILETLKIFDNLARAKEQMPKDIMSSDWARGFFQIEKEFQSFLEKENVQEIKAMGMKFDPNFHEAVGQVEKNKEKPGSVVEILEKGYILNGKVLRPAKVKVNK